MDPELAASIQVWDRSPLCKVERWVVYGELERTNQVYQSDGTEKGGPFMLEKSGKCI
jgi:hypothetical protein